MSGFFAVLGLLLGVYTVYAAVSGAVFARRGAWGRSIVRTEEPFNFWSTIVIYAALTAVLLFYF